MITREEAAVAIMKYYKFVLEEDSNLLIVLKGHLLIENQIENLLKSALIKPNALDFNRLNFPFKLDLLVAIGILSQEDIIAYKRFNSMRNKFAHNIDYEVNEEDIAIIKNTLSAKHLVFFEEEDYVKELEFNKKLKIIILTLFTLLIIHNASDESQDNQQIKQLDVKTLMEIKIYAESIVNKKDNQ